MSNFSILSNQKCREWIGQLGSAFMLLPEDKFKVKVFSQEERDENHHHFYISVIYTTPYAQWDFDIGMQERFHKIGCPIGKCYGNCVRNQPPQNIRKMNEVVWCVSHKNVNGYVEDITRVQHGVELIKAFKFFLDKYQNKCAPQLIYFEDFDEEVDVSA